MFFSERISRAVVGGVVSISFLTAAVLFTGCPDEEEPMPMGQEPAEPAEPQQAEMPEPEEIDPGELEMPDLEMPEPEGVDIEDSDRAPDTVLATVGGEDIILQDLYDEFDRIPPQQQEQLQHQQPQLLEQMIQQRLLQEEAREKEVEESEEFKEMVRQLEASPMAAELGEDEIKESAMMETLIQREVVEKVDISEEELRETFEQYAQMMPEDADFEQMKPQLEQVVLHEHVMNYIEQLQDDGEVDINEDWVGEKEQEAMDARPPMMPEGEAPPVQ